MQIDSFSILNAVYSVVVLACLATIAVAIYVYVGKRVRVRSLDLKLIRVRVTMPDKNKEFGKDFLFSEINRTEQLLSALSALDRPFVIEVAVHNQGEEIQFYVAVPREKVDFAIRELHGVFPDSRVDEVDDYTVFGPNSSAAGAYAVYASDFVLPIRTYRESEADTFAPIVSTFSKLAASNEGAALQLVVNPAKNDSDAKKYLFGAIERLKKGEKINDVLRTELFKMKDIKGFLETPKSDEPSAPRVVDENSVQALTQKASKPLFSVNVRLISSAESQDRAEDIVMAIGGSFAQMSAPNRNAIKLIKPKNIRDLAYAFAFRVYDNEHALIMNSEEIASIFHFPTFSTNVPRISWVNTREAPAPENLPENGTVIGVSSYRGEEKLVKMTDEDRRRHFYIVGQTGTGKSLLMQTMIRRDMEAGKGLCLIDPHGETVDKVLAMVPKERIEDVIVFNPGDLERPLGLNMLEYNFDRPEEKTFIVNEMQSIFNQLFSKETMGPMFEQYMRNALLLLMEDANNEPATLMEIPRVFTDEAFRRRKLARITNPAVIDFWEKEANKTTGEQGLANMAPYITSKFGNFISNDYMRPIIGQTKSAFNFREVMDSGKILLVSLAKGRIGDLNSQLLGMIVVGRLLLAALSREDIKNDNDRRDFYLYIDEFQNYSTDSIAVILSEARKYRLNLIIAHQFIAQLKDNIREAVFGNVGSLLAFRVGVPDTEFLLKHFGPEFTEKDLIGVENLHGFLKMLINGHPARPFDMKIIFPPKGVPEIRDKMKELSRLTYGRDIADIEQDILKRLRQ